MANLSSLGLTHLPRPGAANANPQHVLLQQPLHRILAFTRHSIHDVINNPIAQKEVLAYYKLHRWVQRESEISDLEHHWNAT